MAAQIHERTAREAVQACLQVRKGHVQRCGQRREIFYCGEQAGIGHQRNHGGTHGEGFTATVCNHAPVGGNFRVAHGPTLALVLQETAAMFDIQNLQRQYAPHQQCEHGQQCDSHQVKAPGRYGSEARPTHGRTTLRLSSTGACICNSRVATRSTR